MDNALGGSTRLEIDDSWGLAALIGTDITINEHWFFNTALWYVEIDADATLKTNGVRRDIDIKIDPWVFFVGVGKKF